MRFMTKPLICLSCIVGNEEAVIERFIRSFEPAVDFAVFVQAIGTAKSDNTMEIIARVCDELDLPYIRQIYWNGQSWPHVDDFSKARSQAWDEAAKTKADYLLWADCDDLIDEKTARLLRAAAESGEKDVFLCPYHVRGKAQIVVRERLIKNDNFAYWRFPVHEMMGFRREVSTRVLSDAIFTHSPLPGTKGNSNQRNRTILEHAIADNARSLFFLAQEAASCGDRDAYLSYAKGALNHPCAETLEKYELLLMLAQSEQNCETAKGYASRAFDLMPDRREALALLACYALVDGRNDEAYHLAKHLICIPKPRFSYWTLNHEWYDWKGFYLLTQTMRAVGKKEEAEKLEKEQFEKAGTTFSICHPTYMRPHQALALRDIYFSRASNPMAVEYIFGLHHNDPESLKLLSGFRHTVTDKEGCCPNTLEPLRASTGKFVMVIADDLFPPEGWDEQILKTIPDMTKPVVLAFNDSCRTDEHLCHGFMTRPYLETMLADPWPGTGIYSDNEFTWRAKKAGVIVKAPQIVFDHRHYTRGLAPVDDTYADQNKPENYKEGARLFRERNPDFTYAENNPN